MSLRELQEQALKLSVEERWQLINALMRSLQPNVQSTVKPKGLAASLIGIAKTDTPPTDENVKAMLDERLVACAIVLGLEAIVTRDVNGFTGSPILVLSPEGLRDRLA